MDRARRRGHVLNEVLLERARQDEKWGTSFPGRPHERWLAIVTEEVGEAAEAILQSDHHKQEKAQKSRADIRKEVVQIAASALSWLEHGEWSEYGIH